ncbi:hypothetical protein K0M31_007837 [Melipona bicolor]|uniref:Uncharacterized protein n=1 Tax=Melipona bicolor TaxID=60889 RepID=A0AA40GDJ6_9HYME|nr:hypothetical protein K0M31_007837 [Melipona bicolor]
MSGYTQKYTSRDCSYNKYNKYSGVQTPLATVYTSPSLQSSKANVDESRSIPRYKLSLDKKRHSRVVCDSFDVDSQIKKKEKSERRRATPTDNEEVSVLVIGFGETEVGEVGVCESCSEESAAGVTASRGRAFSRRSLADFSCCRKGRSCNGVGEEERKKADEAERKRRGVLEEGEEERGRKVRTKTFGSELSGRVKQKARR